MRDLSHFVKHNAGTAGMDLALEGVSCAGCVAKIERGLFALPDITKARVNLTERRLAVEWTDGAIDPAKIVDRIAELGYRAHPYEAASAEKSEIAETRFLLRCLGVAAFAAMNVMLLSVSVWSGNASDISPEQRDFFHWLSALIALPAAAYAGQPFFRSALRALKVRHTNMDVPISIGVILALALSVYETWHHAEHAYFDASVMLLTFLLAGRYLDQSMRRRTSAIATNLAALRADMATKVVDDELIESPVAAIVPGDLVLVRPGERIAVDGVVIGGSSDIDNSLVTGETAYLAARPGSAVFSGTLNVSGLLRIKATKPASGSLLDEIDKLLQKATAERTRYVRLADRAASLYAPVVHTTALLTLFGWVLLGAGVHDSIVIAISVLIITCPCALGLAIPAVQVVAVGALFRAGVLLNRGDALERLAEVDTIVFDKTGTLTLPEPEVANAAAIDVQTLSLAGRLALGSRHPLAVALAKAVGAREPLPAVVEQAGRGVLSVVDGQPLRLGSPEFCDAQAQTAEVSASYPDASVIAFSQGKTRVVFAFRQRLREDAAAVIAGLKQAGYRIAILSGDRKESVAEIAAVLSIDAWQAGLSPADKIARIEEMRRAGQRVLMVGDGLNDAPSLAAANVSMSPVSATHLAQAAADAIFLGERLEPVATALKLSRRAFKVMKQNLWLAVIYNAIALPVAIAGFVTPLIAAAAMSGSSILVTANALRARAGVKQAQEGAVPWKS
jgi:P-type Cu2+ transporter